MDETPRSGSELKQMDHTERCTKHSVVWNQHLRPQDQTRDRNVVPKKDPEQQTSSTQRQPAAAVKAQQLLFLDIVLCRGGALEIISSQTLKIISVNFPLPDPLSGRKVSGYICLENARCSRSPPPQHNDIERRIFFHFWGVLVSWRRCTPMHDVLARGNISHVRLRGLLGYPSHLSLLTHTLSCNNRTVW